MVLKFITNFIRYLKLKKCRSSCCSIDIDCSPTHTPVSTHPPSLNNINEIAL